MAKKIEIIGQALVITDTDSSVVVFEAPKAEYYYSIKSLQNEHKIRFYNLDHEDNASARPLTIQLSDAVDSTSTPFSLTSFQTFARNNLGFKTSTNGNGNSYQVNENFGFMDYNDTTGEVSLVAGVWTDVPNNGLGAFTNKTHKPSSINEVMDTSTGYLDFSDLTLGSQLIIRNDFNVIPNTNNALLEVRYLLGQGAGEYPLLFWSERLDNGSGIVYQRVPVFTIYMGDTNTQGGVGKLQMRLSSNGTLNNAGSYINIQVR